MATQMYLLHTDDQLADAAKLVSDLRENYLYEAEVETTGRCYPENKDVWAGVYRNARSLHVELGRLLNVLNCEFEKDPHCRVRS